MGQNDVTPARKQTTLDLVLQGINDLKDDVSGLRRDFALVEGRTNDALNLAFQAHEKAKTAVWMRTSWAPYIVSALAAGLAAVALGVVIAR